MPLYAVEAQYNAAVPTYRASAVHFAGSNQGDGTTYLNIASLACTNNGYFSFSIWSHNLCDENNDSAVIYVVDPAVDYVIYAKAHVFGPVPPSSLLFAYGTVADASSIGIAALPVTGWHNIIGSVDVNRASATQIMSIYFDDILDTPLTTAPNSSNAAVNLMNGKRFVFGDDSFSSGPTCDFADVWIAPGVKLHETDGTISEANRRKFITASLKPADPAGWPTSAIQFYGNASNFATNRGTGGVFTLTGSLTNASTHP
jgi:hypothetical protein